MVARAGATTTFGLTLLEIPTLLVLDPLIDVALALFPPIDVPPPIDVAFGGVASKAGFEEGGVASKAGFAEGGEASKAGFVVGGRASKTGLVVGGRASKTGGEASKAGLPPPPGTKLDAPADGVQPEALGFMGRFEEFSCRDVEL